LETTKRLDLLEISARIDEDDHLSIPVLENYHNMIGLVTTIGLPKQPHHGAYWNDACFAATGELLTMIGDDFAFRTPGWDEEIRKEFNRFPDRILFVFGNDGVQQNGYIGTHGTIHRRWVDTLGYYVPMQFVAYCHDTWLDDIAKRCGRRIYRPDLYFEHLHYCVGKSVKDDNYRRMEDRLVDDIKLFNELAGVRKADAEKLKRIMQ
jgi:hypothetical protein